MCIRLTHACQMEYSQAVCCDAVCRELSRRMDSFVLRRTNEINARYLPPLTNYVVFCRPSDLQVSSTTNRLVIC